ncbi:hypothetical protein SAMN04488003_11297 [Loktanella fryxellensis]|uniref:Uncharacterized protein n=1 Tax=Loktanella fryxellensis TaxID=245187 RepID=A0A1H8FA84_9RHOB|nr:hypothetical protein [Loktanella fryxellensis]SEN28486.1 hypothetical protein SAMN04488003_11297 [Loktanella fryxellensis]
MDAGDDTVVVRRRRVFYIPGYDPFHPRRYRELYRTEGTAQAAISGFSLALKPKPRGKTYGWLVDAVIEGQAVQADVDVLVWSDIVRDSMSRSIPATYAQLLRTAWTYIGSGALLRLMRLRKGPVIAALYPVGMLLAQLVAAVLLGLLVVTLAGLIPVAGALASAVAAAGWGAGVAVAVAVLRWFKRRDGKLYAHYLMHDYAFSARWNGANPPALEARMTAFGDRIAAALASDVDEVLVVGHSSGAHLGVSILADLHRAGRVPQQGPQLSFLSLGQVVPMMSFLPDAKRLRRDLHALSTTDMAWVDITAPGDGCAFALCDPVAVSGVAPPDARWPLVISAAFTQTLSPERWTALRWKFLRLHFQYLCAFDRPRDYDYFRVTAGPLTLGYRYRDRAPSASRIATPTSGHVDMGA